MITRGLRAGAAVAPPWIAVLVLVEHAPSAGARLIAATGPTSARLEVLLGDLALLVATAATAWLCALTVVALVCRLCRRPVPTGLLRLSPGPWRRAVLAVAGSSLVLAVPAAAVAGAPGAPGEPAGPRTAGAPSSVSLRGLALPDRPAELRRSTVRTSRPPSAPRTRYRVRAGDSLWRIAAASWRGEEPTAAQLDGEWRRWYAANRARIGDDPHALRIGMVLRAPTTSPPSETSPSSDPPH
ncbi:LysM peptidoglycan-binding domain-containing protein [Mumia quercus]|uniref:LysM peptidoglycan-binding domain-containing protein n=1 Tax=Mumia quercus TaxID=2976125 RepID=UPI0021CF57D3|nr:LysM peptidoglycan-binding domain-containing protein [Mumia quercus]